MIRQDLELKSRHIKPAIKLFEGRVIIAKVSTLAGSSRKKCVYAHNTIVPVKATPMGGGGGNRERVPFF
jgi:hypothetical protein